jgi:Dyp-type peroxidase family
MPDRVLDLDDIQGNVLGGFNTDVQVLIALTVMTEDKFRQAILWVASLAPTVTVVSEVRAQRELMKSAKPAPRATWLSVAVGARFLKATHPEIRIGDSAFILGMPQRAPSVLGDKTDPAQWRVGGTSTPVDVFLVVAANDETAVQQRADELVKAAERAGLAVHYRETCRRLDDREHFGFRDGVSQPQIVGDDAGGEGGLCAGNFIFGYPREAGQPGYSPVVDDAHITDNGSLLVFRRLAQDVGAFRKFCDEEAQRLAPQWPGLSASHLAALIVGRWPSGTPVKAGQHNDPLGDPRNDFDFSDDAEPASCPYGAHIRKVNPRAGKKDLRPVPRILRRGIPFGPLYDTEPGAERGLAFLAFQTSLTGQFETLTSRWMNSALNPGPGNDILVGRSAGIRVMQIPGPKGPIEISTPERGWIVPTGGAYLFAPGRAGLAKLAAPPAPLGLWKAKQIVASISDSFSALFER